MAIWKGSHNPILRELTITMVFNHLLTEMILQVDIQAILQSYLVILVRIPFSGDVSRFKHRYCTRYWVFPKIAVGPPNHPFCNMGFSIIFTIHFGGNHPILGTTHMTGGWIVVGQGHPSIHERTWISRRLSKTVYRDMVAAPFPNLLGGSSQLVSR